MFRGPASNSYDDLVAKTTDENLTSENWEFILNLCDKVQEEGEAGARNVIAAVLKRLAHRNPNVQLYALAVAEALSKNCGIQINREIASRSFTQGLERLVTDRTSHDKVKRKTLSLVHMWTAEFESDPSLGIMEELHDNLRNKGYKFEEPQEPPPPQVDDEIRRREEEELQLALEMSVRDKGGRSAWQSYNGGSSSSAGPSSSAFPTATSHTAEVPAGGIPSHHGTTDYGYAKKTTGYVPARTPSPMAPSPTIPVSPATTALPSYSAAASSSTQLDSSSQTSLPLTSVSRVRALHNFEGTEQGELTFEKGDIIKVVDRNYKDWWRGQLKGRTGIFPVNYVELLPDPTPEEIAREAEHEAAIFAQAANIDKLLSMLRGLDPARDSLADNEEIQELYRTSMSLRPKIVKLIDKYSQKRAELVSMNETFVKARTLFDRMMEESLARHSGLYDGRPAFQPASPGYGAPYGQGYAGFPQANTGYPAATPTPGPQPYGAPGYATQRPSYGPYPAQQTASPYIQPQAPAQTESAAAYGSYQQPPAGQAQIQGAPQPYAPQQPQPPAQPQQGQQNFHGVAQTPAQTQTQQNGYQEPAPTPQAQQQPAAQSQLQPQAQAQAQAPAVMQGPPYVFDPNATYPDPNAQAWVQYYAQGGDDPTGAVYFISVPGITQGSPGQSQSQPQPERQASQGTTDAQQTQPSGSPTAERTSFHQAHPIQPSGYFTQPQPAPNGSGVSVGSTTQGAPQQQQQPAGAPQQYQSQPSGGPPTSPITLQGRGSFYGSAPPLQSQPGSPGGASAPPPVQGQQPYPPNPYPDPTAAHPTSPPVAVGQQVDSAYAHSQPQQPGYGNMNDPYVQMHGQFAGMGMGEPRSPSAATATPAVQTA